MLLTDVMDIIIENSKSFLKLFNLLIDSMSRKFYFTWFGKKKYFAHWVMAKNDFGLFQKTER